MEMEIIHHKKSIAKKMIDYPEYLNRNQALLECKDHISQLSYTSFMAHTVYLGHYVWQYGELCPNNTPDYELVYLFERNK